MYEHEARGRLDVKIFAPENEAPQTAKKSDNIKYCSMQGLSLVLHPGYAEGTSQRLTSAELGGAEIVTRLRKPVEGNEFDGVLRR